MGEKTQTVAEFAKKEPKSFIGRAYAFAERAHKGQKRKSGEPYFTHPLATAETLTKWRLDETSVAAGLLHDVVEDTPVTREEVVKEFGEEVAFLVDGVTKLSRVKYRGAEEKIENMRKMIFALGQDLRVVFVKLADRLHNMKTLGALPPQKQKRIAMETDEIYAPIAHRLGMHELAGELHDLAFQYLHPKELKWLKDTASEELAARRKYLERIRPEFEKILKDAEIAPLRIDFRAKHYYSLYRKLLKYEMDISKIYDLVAMRAVFPTVEDCYGALGAVHHAWRPLPGRIKDYIAMPKANNYQSLHTTVIGPEDKSVEIQFRTEDMHAANEYGIAAHWQYKEKKGTARATKDMQETSAWIGQIKAWYEHHRGENVDPEDLMKAMKVEFFKDRVFAITPHGDVIDLPEGATPVDFAYRIHSEIGDTCVGAKVNGKFVPLNHALASGDLVEIITQKNKRPSEDWLSFARTGLAKEHIRASVRKKQRMLDVRRPAAKTLFKITVEDRVGILKDITNTLARSHVNIADVKIEHSPGSKFPVDKFTCNLLSKDKIEKVILKLKKIEGVREIGYQLL